MTSQDFEKIIQWVEFLGTNRSISIDYSPNLNNKGIECYVYDYNVQDGKHISCAEELPTEIELKEIKCKRLQGEISRL